MYKVYKYNMFKPKRHFVGNHMSWLTLFLYLAPNKMYSRKVILEIFVGILFLQIALKEFATRA